MSAEDLRGTVLAIGALCVLALLPLVLSDWLVFLIALALAKGAVVLGVVLLLRGGLISFGHALYFAIGAYTVGFLANRFGIGEALVALPLAIVISALSAAALGLLLARFRGIYFAMLSLAFPFCSNSTISPAGPMGSACAALRSRV
jgi:branched-chain amino acid transport system permease protein